MTGFNGVFGGAFGCAVALVIAFDLVVYFLLFLFDMVSFFVTLHQEHPLSKTVSTKSGEAQLAC